MSKNIFHTILNPKSIAVVGASRDPSKVGHQVLKNIISSGFRGKIFPVNPNARSILNLQSYPTVSHIPGTPPDLVIIITPAPLVEPIIIESNAQKVPAVIVISAGFAESGLKGATLQAHLKKVTQALKVRVLGPNCLGCFSTVNRLNATFGPALPQKGNIMLISQSGALVTGILDWANAHNLGLSHAITLGNRLDISEIDALEFALNDKHTGLVMIYLESFANATQFFQLASKVTLKKPVILLKGGQSSQGQKASASHTAALATNYVLVKAWCRQTGVMLTDTLESWLSLASVLHSLPPLHNNRVGIITNAGGPGVLTTDEAIQRHLDVPVLSKSTRIHLNRDLPRVVAQNPLDLLGDAQPEDFIKATSALLEDENLGSLVLIMTPQTTTKPFKTAQLLTPLIKGSRKAVIVVLVGGKVLRTARAVFENASIPVFTYPTPAIEALSQSYLLTSYRSHASTYPSPIRIPVSNTDQIKGNHLLTHPLTLNNAFKLLQMYNLTIPDYQIIDDKSALPKALSTLHRPVVLKTANMGLKHKAKLGGVYLDIMTNVQARIAYERLKRLSPQVIVQKTIAAQAELIIGSKRDPQLGTFITFGMGGSLTDALSDRVYAFIPASRNYLKELLINYL